jgi:hypothetical protein
MMVPAGSKVLIVRRHRHQLLHVFSLQSLLLLTLMGILEILIDDCRNICRHCYLIGAIIAIINSSN